MCVNARGSRHQSYVFETNFKSKTEFELHETNSNPEMNYESISKVELDEAVTKTDSASKTHFDLETDYEAVSEFKLNEAMFETDSTLACNLILPGTKIPKWFNHQSFGSSISFSVGRKFPSFTFCVALKVKVKDIGPNPQEYFDCNIYVVVNGFKVWLASHNFYLDPSSSFMWCNYRSDSSLEGIVLDLDDWNDVKLLCKFSNYNPK